ncbi:MAG: glycoside hydrolase family 57 protein [Phycisphaerales bacterium]
MRAMVPPGTMVAMASVCFYFQVHQPWRLRDYDLRATDPFYFDDELNELIMKKVANKCYRPATRQILDLVRRHDGRFRVSYAITDTALRQMERWAPDVIELFQALAETGACEFIGETSHHSLAFFFSRDEFDAQVEAHRARMQSLFGVDPVVFRNTELMYNNALAEHMRATGRYRAVICEGVDRLLDYRSPNHVYAPPGRLDDAAGDALAGPRLLLKKYALSDDMAFRFSNRQWDQWPLRAETFAEWIDAINGDGHLCNLFMDYETLGEHQWADTGIFEFLDALPGAVFDVNPGANEFVLPREAAERHAPVGEYDAHEPISWADQERDLTAWLGNGMQRDACRALYALEGPVKERHAAGDEWILEDWRKLTTSDHVYYMSTKFWSDGDVHAYFSPYESPYVAYVRFMNVLDDVARRAGVSMGALVGQP